VSEPQPESIGHPEVVAALDALAALDELPVAEHASLYEAVHDRLRAALTGAGDVPA
jgi:hypothetical protein